MGKNVSKSKIIKFASEKIQTQSYNSFSFAQIAKEFGITTASVHYHFRSKTDLGVAIIKRYREYLASLLDKLEATTTDPWKKLKAYYKYFEVILNKGDQVCTECILSAEYNTLPHLMQEELINLHSDHHDWLVQLLSFGRDNDAFHYEGSAEDKAVYIKSSLHGAMIIARVYGKSDYLQVVWEQIKKDLH